MMVYLIVAGEILTKILNVHLLTNNLRRILLWQHAKGVTELVNVADAKVTEELAAS
jgi:hypothetical protein